VKPPKLFIHDGSQVECLPDAFRARDQLARCRWTKMIVSLNGGYAYASGQHPRQARWSAAKRSGSNGGLGLLVRLPIPGKQVGDFVGGVIWKPGQHVSEPGLRIDVVHLAGFDQGIDGGGSMAAGV
jgi:hypothetical protein